MNQQELWQKFQDWFFYDQSSGFALDISRMNFVDQDFERLEPKLRSALDSMTKLDAGSIANPDEQRMVGHYWLRDSKLSPTKDIASEIEQTLENIKKFAADVHTGKIKPKNSDRFESYILVGIGGSALGPQLLQAALTAACSKMRAYFFDNTDPDGINTTLESIPDLSKTLVLVISKSGGTKETYNGQVIAKEYFKAKGLDVSQCFIAVTQSGSALDKIAVSENWLARFPMWDWVGGRTSLWSAVGLLPAALLGIDISELLAGAKAMDQLNRNSNPKNNPACLLAFAAYHVGSGTGSKNMVVLPYKDRLALFSKYLQQLIMESLGKELDLDGKTVNQGIAVFGNKGATDQHSYIQQLRDGVNNFYAVFIEVLKDRTQFELQDLGKSHPAMVEVEAGISAGDYLSGFYQGTRKALYENSRQSISLTIEELTSYSLGQLLALFERMVGIYACLVNVNAYHQPGVEAGKKAAGAVILAQKQIQAILNDSQSELTVKEVIAKGSELDPETTFKILRHLLANQKVKVSKGENIFEDRYSINL
jgi:glucose-6-phosphate isomerase